MDINYTIFFINLLLCTNKFQTMNQLTYSNDKLKTRKIFLVLALIFCSISLFSQTSGNISEEILEGKAYVAFVGRQAINTIITSSDAMKGRALGCMLDGRGLPVQSFKLTVEKNGSKKSAFSKNNNLTPYQISLLQNLPAGSKIIFSEVKVRFLDGSIGFIEDGVFIIR